MPETAFSECFLLVSDLTAARAFYESTLGIDPSDVDKQSVRYEGHGTDFKLQADYPTAVFEEFNIDQPTEDDRGSGAIFVLELEDDIETIHRRVVDSDGKACIPPRTVEWLDEPMFIAQDPDGYTIEIR